VWERHSEDSELSSSLEPFQAAFPSLVAFPWGIRIAHLEIPFRAPLCMLERREEPYKHLKRKTNNRIRLNFRESTGKKKSRTYLVARS
jgi:hypothetical protein